MIQSKLKHPNIVRFFANFVDQDNVYFLLDLCPNGSLSDLQRRRGVVTNPEARYFLNEVFLKFVVVFISCFVDRQRRSVSSFTENHPPGKPLVRLLMVNRLYRILNSPTCS